MKKRWTDSDDAIIKQHCDDKTDAEIAKILGRTRQAVASRRYAIGIVKMPKWTDEEVQILRDNYLTCSDEELTKMLPGRTEVMVGHKRRKCGFLRGSYKFWTDEDEDIVRQNWKNKTNAELAEMLGRTAAGVAVRKHKLGLGVIRKEEK